MFLLNNFLLIGIGFVMLWLGAELLIKAALAISKKLGWSETLVGLTIVSFCINLPEIMITFVGAFKQLQGDQVTQLVIGNVVGSNMSQIGLVLGLAGLFQVIKVDKKEVMRNGLMLIGSTLLLIAFSINGFISRIEGLVLLLLYGFYLFTLNKTSSRKLVKKHSRKFSFKNNLRFFIQLASGLIVIVLGSELVVSRAVNISQILQIDQMIVGLFIVGIGVSLPELFVAISALIKGSPGLSVGSMLGGNIIVTLLGLGGTAIIAGWHIPRSIATFDLAYLLLTSVVVVLFLLTKKKLERKESVLILLMYMIFVFLKALGL
jgi:cation:H+ antiporter